MAERRRWVEAIERVARAWRNPEHPARAEAVARTLAAPNRFTEEAVAFAVNQRMHALTREALAAWIGAAPAQPRTVGVLVPGGEPMAGLDDVLAVVLGGHACLAATAPASPALLPSFVADVVAQGMALPVRWGTPATVWKEAEALVADEAAVSEGAAAGGQAGGPPPERRLIRPPRFAVAVLDGRETAHERENLAEDVLLYEGQSPCNVALIWAPRDLAPDPYLEAFALFRGVFPTHPDTPGALQMQKAMLEAWGVPHAYGEGPSFLVSKGAPERQAPGHLRWSEYDDLAEVRAWLAAHAEGLSAVVARGALAARLAPGLQVTAPGHVHRPSMEAPPADLSAFLATV